MPTKTVLTIAGFDPSSGAGITADLMVFAAHGLFGTSCITAMTVQSTLGVQSTYPIKGKIVGETLACLDVDLPPAGVKIGMISSKNNVSEISHYLAKLNHRHDHSATSKDLPPYIPIVLDPVIRSSSGRELLTSLGVAALQKRLLPLVDWVTPNLDELAVLLNMKSITHSKIPDACLALQVKVARPGNARRPLGIIATGGHLNTPNDFLLMPTGESLWLPGERVNTKATHGTGCAFSSAFLSRLVLGDGPKEAAKAAKAYVAGALRAAREIGAGAGPINHLWNYQDD